MSSKVSIIIPVYNGANFLSEAIDSALSQTYPNKEVIVVNDGSIDRGTTEKIARGYGRRIRYFKKKNGGVATALNLGIKKMKGVYFSWLSHDDIYLKNKISNQMEKISKLPPKTILFSNFNLIDAKGSVLGKSEIKKYPKSEFIYSLIIGRYLHGCSLLIPKQAFVDSGLFDENLRNTQDYDLWFKMAKKGYNFIFSPEYLINARIHLGQGQFTQKARQIKEEDYLYHRVLQNFTPKEIFGKKSDPANYYFRLALKLKQANATEAYRLAKKLGLELWKKKPNFNGLSLLIACSLWQNQIQPIYWARKILRR